MAKIRIKLRLSTVSGKSGTIYYQVTHKKEVKQITTQIHLLPEEWDAREERIIVESFPAMSRLAVLQKKIDYDKSLLQRIIHQLELSDESFGVECILERFHTLRESVYVLETLKKEISELSAKEKHSTVKNFRCCHNSFSEYLHGKDISFGELTEVIVSDYEEWLQNKGVKRNTTSFYMRTLQSIYNKVVKQGQIKQSIPFKKVYTGVDKTPKRAVDEKVVAALKALELSGTSWLARARDMFIFSYCTRGMSFVDMAYLKQENIVNGVIHYSRKKTRQPLVVHIEPCVQEIIHRYRNVSWQSYIFPVIRSDSSQAAYRNYQTGLRYYNKQLKKLSAMLGGDISLTSYTARHSWATTAYRHNTPLGIISEGMGHRSEKTTQIYLDSINEDVIDRINAKIVALLDKQNSGRKGKLRK